MQFWWLAALRAQFLIESLADLKNNLTKRGLNLLIQHGKPEEILPSLAKTYGVHTVELFPYYLISSTSSFIMIFQLIKAVDCWYVI